MDKPAEKQETSLTVSTKFDPSENQVKFLQAAINVGTYKNKSSVAEQAGVDRSTWYNWLKEDGFPEWFYSEFNRSIQFRVFELDMICFNQASRDFKYMELLQKKYGGLSSKESGLNINVSANAKAEAKPEIELGTDEAKKRLSRNLGILSRYGHNFKAVSEN